MPASLHYSTEDLARLVDTLLLYPDRNFTFFCGASAAHIAFSELHGHVMQGITTVTRNGMEHGNCVGVIAENGYDALLMDLVLLKLGCTSIHLPENSAAELLKAFGVQRLDWIVTTASFRHLLDANESYAVSCELSGLTLFRRIEKTESSDLHQACTSAVIFSSGTSGRLKKILVNNAGVIHNADVFFSSFGPCEGDIFLIFLPLSNYQQKLLIYGCIAWGIDVCLTTPANVHSALKSIQPTLFLAPPVFYESAWKTTRDFSQPGSTGEAQRLRACFGGRMRIMWSGMAPIAAHILQDYQDSGIPLLEAYGMTEYGPIAANTIEKNRIGSVGLPLTKDSVQISGDGEIILHSANPLTCGYLDETQEEERQIYQKPNQIATGDLGHIDSDGFLFIQGRKNETIITSSGYKIHPQTVESAFHTLPFVRHAVLMGKDQPHLGLLIIVSQIEPGMEEGIKEKIKEINSSICRASPIRKWSLHAGTFSSENGFLTRNLKLHRKNIEREYQALLFSQ